MSNRYRPTEIAAITAPVTARNSRNAKNRPVTELGRCTPSQLFNYIGLDHTGTVCVIGNPAKGIGIATAMIRRSQKPFLLIGPAADRQSIFTTLEPDWTMESAQVDLPDGNGALLLEHPYSSYLELCEYFENWSRHYFPIIHLSGGVQIGPEVLNLLNSAQQCLVFCDSVPQSLRNNESRTITPKEFLSQMSYLFVFSAGVATKDLIELLPTYQYEKASNTININSYRSRPIFHPFRVHKGYSVSMGQTRTMEYQKNLFEMGELQRILTDGIMLTYNARTNNVFLAQIA